MTAKQNKSGDTDINGVGNGGSEATLAMRGNCDHNGSNSHAQTQTSEIRTPKERSSATFNLEIKPKGPPIFHGRAQEDVVTWLAKVDDFFYLTEANPRQQVSYAGMLLQDIAVD